MDLYAGLDVSLESTNICIVRAEGRVLMETRAGSDPETIAMEMKRIGDSRVRVDFEAGQLSQWLYFGLVQAGLPAVDRVPPTKAVMVAMNRNKNDRDDARSIAHLVRSRWFKGVHMKSVASQELRFLLTARECFVKRYATTRMRFAGYCDPLV